MSSIACQTEDGNTAIFVGTFLESGNAVTVCRDCLEAFTVALAQELTGVPVIQLVADHLATGPDAALATGLTDAEVEQQAWLTDHKEAIESVMAEGGTFDEAVAAIMEIEDELTDPTSEYSRRAN